jgi:hypothetical protein
MGAESEWPGSEVGRRLAASAKEYESLRARAFPIIDGASSASLRLWHFAAPRMRRAHARSPASEYVGSREASHRSPLRHNDTRGVASSLRIPLWWRTMSAQAILAVPVRGSYRVPIAGRNRHPGAEIRIKVANFGEARHGERPSLPPAQWRRARRCPTRLRTSLGLW